jgi:Zn-dependent protease with chaperone function
MIARFQSMLNLKGKKTLTNKEYVRKFFARPEHSWIVTNRYIKDKFDELFEVLPKNTLKFISKNAEIVFQPSAGKFAAAVTNHNTHVIVVFPELMTLLKSPMNEDAIAIILHELGHIILEHGNKKIEPIEAQVEADRFAADLGYASALAEFLENQPESMEKRVRLKYLTPIVIKED